MRYHVSAVLDPMYCAFALYLSSAFCHWHGPPGQVYDRTQEGKRRSLAQTELRDSAESVWERLHDVVSFVQIHGKGNHREDRVFYGTVVVTLDGQEIGCVIVSSRTHCWSGQDSRHILLHDNCYYHEERKHLELWSHDLWSMMKLREGE